MSKIYKFAARISLCVLIILGAVGCDTFKSQSESIEPPAYEFIRVDLNSSLSGLLGYGSGIALLDDWAFASSSSCRGFTEAFEGIAIFKRIGESWVENQILQNPLGLLGFGCYVTASGNYLAATAGSELNGINGVVIFELEGDEWKYLQTLRPVAGQAYSEFGHAISMSGDRLVVGNPGENSKVYTYLRSGEYYEIEQVIVNPDESVLSFGRGVDIDGNTMVIASKDYRSFQNSAFYIYNFDGERWSLTFQETRSSGQDPYGFARSVAVDNESVFIGSGSTTDGTKEGGVELYTVAGYQDTVATAFDSLGVDHGFAIHIAADDNRILVSEGGLHRVRLFEKFKSGYSEVGVIDNTLSEGALQHSAIDINKGWIGISSSSDRSAFMYLMIRVR